MAHIKASVVDPDRHFEIDANSRLITAYFGNTEILMQGDHDSEVFRFRMPKIIEGHDMTECDRVEIHFTNTSSDNVNVSKGVFVVKDLAIEDDEFITFSWTISRKVTKYGGRLKFNIKFRCTEENRIIYSWGAYCEGGDWVREAEDNNASGDEEALFVGKINENGTYEVGEFDRIEVSIKGAVRFKCSYIKYYDTITPQTFYAVEGMTWRELAASPLNELYYIVINGDAVCFESFAVLRDVKPDDKIIEGKTYDTYLPFTVEGVSYECPYGMSWRGWVGSKYDTSGGAFTIVGEGYNAIVYYHGEILHESADYDHPTYAFYTIYNDTDYSRH